MSKKVSIIEGQTSKHFGKTSKLQTKLRSEGYCFWVPKDESKLVTKRITKNGTYYARNEKDTNKVPYYGFSRITVAVSNKIHGKKKENPPSPPAHNGDWMYPQNGDGNDYGYSSDDNGNVIERALPSSIKITELPVKTSYHEGEAIDITGITVKAYNADGSLWSQVPFEELTFEPQNASHSSGTAAKTSDLIDNQTISAGDGRGQVINWNVIVGSAEIGILYDGICAVYFAMPGERARAVIASKIDRSQTYTVLLEEYFKGAIKLYEIPITESLSSFTYKNKTVYYCEIPFTSSYQGVSIDYSNFQVLNDSHDDLARRVAWTLLYGEDVEMENLVTITWNRPEDQAPLTDTFNIAVS